MVYDNAVLYSCVEFNYLAFDVCQCHDTDMLLL